MFFDIWDVYQHKQIGDLQRDTRSLKGEAQRARHQAQWDIGRLEGKIDSLALVTQAMWELLEAHTDLTEADIRAKIVEIDERDGVRDGKMGSTPSRCEGCGREAHSRVSNCMYCGHPIQGHHVAQPRA